MQLSEYFPPFINETLESYYIHINQIKLHTYSRKKEKGKAFKIVEMTPGFLCAISCPRVNLKEATNPDLLSRSISCYIMSHNKHLGCIYNLL